MGRKKGGRKGRRKAAQQPLRDPAGQTDLFETPVEEEREARRREHVECLGMTFENDEGRRAYFTGILREKLREPDFRKSDGFPLAEDEGILSLSDPPYYTACPNPFLEAFARQHQGTGDPDTPYHREPFAVDVSEGKTDRLYRAHTYHTKVPHLAIVPSILHYTSPGDIVLDGFCGSGMTGVAAQWCGTAPQDFRRALEAEWASEGRRTPEWGVRYVILGDLSPAATFIAANYNVPFHITAFAEAARQLLADAKADIGWMYETLHKDGRARGRINYTVWSEVFTCPECSGEVVFIAEALDGDTNKTRSTFPCPHCATELNKDTLQRCFETLVDPASGKPWKRIRLRPVLINYSVGGNRYEKEPDENDLEVLPRIADLPLPPEVPTTSFPIDEMYHGSRLAPKGFTRIHHMFLPRAAQALAVLWRRACAEADPRLRSSLLFLVEQAIWGMSVLNRYSPSHYSQVGRALTGVYYVASQHSEVSPWYILDGKLKRIALAFEHEPWTPGAAAITTGDCARLPITDNCVDYVFTDPPFGENIFYADLNLLVESWHRVLTRVEPEAIVDAPRGKGILDYQHLMQRCFEEYRRVLKPGHWMTVVFHNSKNAVWNAIQEAILAAGFVVADVRTLDKQQGSYRQVTSTAVKQDLVISAYKPNSGLEQRFELEAGTEEGVWDFVRTHLRQLPVFVSKSGRVEVVAERQNFLLFDRMVAFHVQRGVTVPLSATELHAGLDQRFPERDGMYFLPEQAVEYDKKRMTVKEIEQLQLFVTDEASAIQWLRRLLKEKSQTFQEVHPQFMREIGGWQKHEKPLELRELLEENFLCYDGEGDVPSQIHSYLSSNWPELRNKAKDDPALRAKAKNRWYVPDPGKAQDLEKLRERALLREFWEYLPPGYSPTKPESPGSYLPGMEPKSGQIPKGKRIKVIRMEAVRAGFKHCWQNRDYRTIIAVALRIRDSVLQEDPKLLMWYDQAVTRSGGDI